MAPPDKFQDPDVDMHKRLDLRNNSDLDGGDVPGLNADTNDRDGDGFDDNTGEPIDEEDSLGADDMQPMLVCPNCGFQVEAGEPTTVDTADPMGANSDAGGPAEGDLCPNCGAAPLESSTDMAQMGEDTADPDVDADAVPDPDVDPDADPHAERDESDPDAIPEDNDENDQDDDSPFPPKNGDDDEDDADAVDPGDDDPEGDELDPAKKKPRPPKR